MTGVPGDMEPAATILVPGRGWMAPRAAILSWSTSIST
jgi:hypothetical protein